MVGEFWFLDVHRHNSTSWSLGDNRRWNAPVADYCDRRLRALQRERCHERLAHCPRMAGYRCDLPFLSFSSWCPASSAEVSGSS